MNWRIGHAARWVARHTASGVIQAVARIGRLHWLPRRLVVPFERILIACEGANLFDDEFYFSQNPDVDAAGLKPLSHYLKDGWREGRAPNPFFDDGHYRVEAGLVRGAPVSALGHFLAFGKQQELCPVPGVDLSRYRAQNPSLGVARIDAYAHLVDSRAVVEDVRPDLAEVLLAIQALEPSRQRASVDIVMPVFRGRAETLNSILHVLQARNSCGFELVVVDDATPDAKLALDLDDLAHRGLITLIRNPDNRGFVTSTNKGSFRHPDRDVVWLNSDTEVYDHWLDRLRAVAGGKGVATVTPLSNNGSICSYPRPNADNPGSLEIGWGELDVLTQQVNTDVVVPAPTAVGFCTYVTRSALNAVGPLDEAAFGRGYGEENDFSLRATAAGFKNVIAANVVVRHFGGTSFKGLKAERIEAALKVLDRKYPRYHADVASWIDQDPLAIARQNLDFARVGRLRRARNILLVTHSRGGGTEQHVQAEIDRLTDAGASVFTLTGGAGGRETARLQHSSGAQFPSLSAISMRDGALWQVLDRLGLDAVHLHHLIDFPIDAPTLFADGLQKAHVPYVYVVHDYFSVCPRINMSDRAGFYCGEPDLDGCRRCLSLRGSSIGFVDIEAWRVRYEDMLTGASAVRVPDQDVADRLSRYFPTIQHIDVRPHEPAVAITPSQTSNQTRSPGPLRVVVIGAIGPTKGFDVLLDLAKYVRSHAISAEMTVIGYTRDDMAAKAAGIRVTGPYVNSDVDNLIEREAPDVILLPSIWPETYCYALSIALRSGRPIAAFAIGAMETRLESVSRAKLLPLETARKPDVLWDGLCAAAKTRKAADVARVPVLRSA
ncbi:MAG: glycosyltransferase [Pseudomonadota bacterium]